MASIGIAGIAAILRFKLTRALPPDVERWAFLALGALGVGFLLLGVAGLAGGRRT